jgi:SAM-dependent methyltransferase
MCNNSGLDFVAGALTESEVKGRRVLEIGSLDVNGSVRPGICRFGPAEYIGTDIVAGKGVDTICRAEDLLERFKPGTFGLIVSTELLEHVRDWRRVISVMKQLLADDGVLIITTRSIGFGYHGYPFDFWRFEEHDMRAIFADMRIDVLESDPLAPGVFFKAVKKAPFIEADLCEYRLYSIVKNGQAENVTDFDCAFAHLRRLPKMFLSRLLPEAVKVYLKSKFKF